ncbi:branched-chain amino acid ABC transporter permease [Actinophytocola algeriensis]|uniref:Branched-chain amino acid transport system permease protein n=1 Tax=Actinophytocola algeriensis TaxID=1768010 RepID=A0A7W7QA18_9PSEU|nr:branched-chain amino acid ABC transporter permease [Actinophytocola algeriensis]MBB4909759.1 branched-chain amino acid transport system permease protein [Actinophytocola algeriensis]MBE1475749.1 branched-chain amino acid transport system permease protein [Actinophytocola algeriensis]
MVRRHLLLALGALVVVVLVLETTSQFRNAQFAAMAYYAIAAAGLTILTGLNGQLSLGHGALMAVGAYSTALMLQSREGTLPLLVILALATVITVVVGALVGVAAARLHGPYLAGATLALAVAIPGIPLYFSEWLGGEQGLNVRMPEIPVWLADAAYFVTGQELTQIRYLAYLGWLGVIVVFVLLANLSRSRVGRNWQAVRDDEVAAELAGINLGRARVQAFVVSAGCAGLAGGLLALSARLAAPSGFTLTLSLLLLSAVVLGGLGSLVGALVGAALLTFLPQVVTGAGTDLGLTDVQAAQLAPLIYGLVTVLVVLLAPAGLAGGLRKLIHWRRSS